MYNRKILQENNNKNNNAADRSKSTQSASPEAADKQHERKRKVLLSPITESTYQEEFSRFEYMNNAQNAHTKHQNHLAKSKDVLNQTNFDQTYGFRYINISLFQRVSFHYRQAAKWKKSEWMRFLSSRMPITGWLLNYNWKSDLFMDILGGVMISVMSVPQSLAYGMLVGVPPSYGLITGIIGPITYALFGTSRHSSPGAFAIVSLMVGGVVERLGSSVAQPFNDTMILTNENGPGIEEYMCCKPDKPAISEQTAIEIATAVTLLVGVFQILFGLMNAGLLAVWLSDHLVQGLTSGAAIHVLTSQLKSMTGISNVPPTSEPFQLIQFYICFFKQIASKTQLSAIICSIICITLLILSAYIIDPFLRKCCSCPIKFPMELLLVIGSTLIVQFTRQTDWHFEIAIVGHVDSGIPTPRVPRFSDPFNMLGPAISIAIISFVIHIALCKLIAKKLNYVIDSNQEWMALGLMHTTSAFFGCFAGGSSLGRTMMQMKIGTKTQLSTIVCAMVLVVFVMGAGRFIYFLPKPVLASIVVMAMKDLFVQLYTAMTIRKTSFFDFMIFVITLTAVLILNVNYGLVVGVAFALLTVVFRTQWADSTLLGRVKGTNHFKGLSHYGAALEIPGIKVFRFDSPLYFANSELFLSRVYSTCGLNPVLVRGKLAEEEKRAKAAEKKRKRREDAEMLLPNTKDETQLEVKGHHVKALNEKTTEKSMGRKEEYEITQLTHIIIDCSSIPYIDLMGLDAIVQIYQEYKTIDIDVLFANTKEVCRQLFDVTDFFKKVPINRMFVSISDAVQQAKLEQQAKYLQGNDQSLRAAPNPIKPLATNQPVAKSVAQKTMPLGGDFTNTALQLPPTQSASVATMVEKSIFSEENPDKRRQKMGEDLDKTQ